MTTMDETTNDDAGLGHNQPLDPDGESGLEAVRDYLDGTLPSTPFPAVRTHARPTS
jgi:hypothetical protein